MAFGVGGGWSTRHGIFCRIVIRRKFPSREIAKKAGVPEGSAYHFFANKYDVFSALAIELGERFSEAVMEPLDPPESASWQDFIYAIIDRSAQIYRNDPIARKVLLSSTMPHEVKNADRESALTYVQTMQSKLEELYEMPSVERLPQRLLYALTLVDALFELDYNSNGNLSEEISEEAKLAMISYLSNFIPVILDPGRNRGSKPIEHGA